MKESHKIQTIRQRAERLERQCFNCMKENCVGCKVDKELADLKYSIETGHISKRRHG